MNPASAKPRVFISYSHADSAFVEELVVDLATRNLNVLWDRRILKTGDTVLERVFEGIRNTEYFIVVLSENSVASLWVILELGAALSKEFENKGTAVLPVRIDNCEIPDPLKSKVYTDFAEQDYDKALHELADAIGQETVAVSSLADLETAQAGIAPTHHTRGSVTACCKAVMGLTLGELRRRMTKRLDADAISLLWFDLFGSTIELQCPERPKDQWVIRLLDRARRRGMMNELVGNLYANCPSIASR